MSFPMFLDNLMETLIAEIKIYEDRQPNGQWLKSIKFRLPIIEEDMDLIMQLRICFCL